MLRTLAIILCLSSSILAAGPRRQIIIPPGPPDDRPHSPGVLSGDFLYVSGAVGIRPGSSEVAGDIGAQTRQALENIGAVLKTAELDYSDVVSSTVYLSDMRDFSAMNEVYRSFFPMNPPARATLEGGIVVPGGRIEISVIAGKSQKPRRIKPDGWKVPGSPYSHGMQVGETLFVAGMVSEDPNSGEIVSGDASDQTRRALENLGQVLSTAGMDYEDVVGCRVFLDDPRDFQTMNEVFRQVFASDPPVRATLKARLAAPEIKIEIQCTASSDAGRKAIGTRAPGRPFSPGIQAADKVYVAGMVGRGPNGFAPGDVAAQTRQALLNVQETLQAAGLALEDIVDVTVFIADVRFLDAMNAVYREMVPEVRPARATVAMDLMSPDALVEIMVTAVRK